MHFLITLFQKYPWQNVQMLFALLLAGVAEIFGLSALLPLVSIAIGNQTGTSTAERLVSDSLSKLGLTPTLEVLMLMIFVAIAVKSGLVLFAKKRIGYTVANVATDLRLALLRALLNSRWEFHLQQPIGKLANAMASETSRTGKAFACGAAMIVALVQAIVAVGVAFLVSWQATLISLVVGVIIFLVVGGLVRKAKKAGWRQTKLLKSLISLLTDSLQSIKPLKAMAREKSAETILITKTTRLNRALQKQVLSNEMLRALQEPLRTVFLLAGLYFALTYWHLPAATVMVLILLIGRLLQQIGKVQQEYQRMVVLESGYWSLQDTIHKAEAQKEILAGNQIPPFKKALRLDRVSFAYGENKVLHDISLIFPKGKITSIVGASGAGKTTIVDLMTGLLRPQQGEVLIDDLPLTDIDMRSWRKMIGYVPQEILLLHDTVLTNVTLGDPELKEEDAVNALQAAKALDFVKRMPLGINSIVGERGGNISGGQRQRIAIARALVHKPKLLILDEATTGLDPESEAAICDTLKQLSGELTIITISHQAALVKIADNTYRIKDGKIVVTQDSSEQPQNSEDVDAQIDSELKVTLNISKAM